MKYALALVPLVLLSCAATDRTSSSARATSPTGSAAGSAAGSATAPQPPVVSERLSTTVIVELVGRRETVQVTAHAEGPRFSVWSSDGQMVGAPVPVTLFLARHPKFRTAIATAPAMRHRTRDMHMDEIDFSAPPPLRARWLWAGM